MVRLVLICMALCCFLHANSYVLLTANVEDVHAIAQQVAKSPVVEQMKSIWRRAKSSFNDSYANSGHKMRAHSGNGQIDSKEEEKLRSKRRRAVQELLDLGRNATAYIKTIKDIVDKI